MISFGLALLCLRLLRPFVPSSTWTKQACKSNRTCESKKKAVKFAHSWALNLPYTSYRFFCFVGKWEFSFFHFQPWNDKSPDIITMMVAICLHRPLCWLPMSRPYSTFPALVLMLLQECVTFSHSCCSDALFHVWEVTNVSVDDDNHREATHVLFGVSAGADRMIPSCWKQPWEGFE